MSSHEHSVVVGVDWSDATRAAIEQGAATAAARHLTLRLVRALERPPHARRPDMGRIGDLDLLLRKAGQRLIEEAVQVLAIAYPGLRVVTAVARGSAVEVLVDESRTAERILVGSHGAGVGRRRGSPFPRRWPPS